MERDKNIHSERSKSKSNDYSPGISFPELWERYRNEKREDIVIKGPKPSEWEY